MKKIIACILLILTVTTVVYALEFYVSIQEHHIIDSGKYAFTINDSDNYRYEYDLSSGSSLTISITNHHVETADVNIYFDILLKTDADDVIVNYGNTELELTANEAKLLWESDEKLGAEASFEMELNITSSMQGSLYVYAIPRKTSLSEESSNCYVSSEFDIRKRLNSFSLNDKKASRLIIPHFILLNDLEISEELIINVPSTFDLLDNELKLSAPFTIEHHYYGVFYINGLSECKIDNSGYMFLIKAPNCFYNIFNNNDNIFIDINNFNDYFENASNEKVAFATEAALNYFENIFVYKYNNSDSSSFFTVVDDIVLPKTYFTYPITYQYITSDATIFNVNGNINRTDDDQDITLDVSIKYDGNIVNVFGSNKHSYTVKVIGSSEDAVYMQTIREITVKLEKMRLAGSFRFGVELPEISMFDETMKLTYEIESDFLKIEGQLLHLIKRPLFGEMVNLGVKYQKGDDTEKGLEVIGIPIAGCTVEERIQLLNSEFGALIFTTNNPYDLFSSEFIKAYEMKNVEYDIVAYKKGDNGEYVFDSELSLAYKNKFIWDENDITESVTLQILSFVEFGLSSEHKVELKATVTWDDDVVSEHFFRVAVPEYGGAGGEELLAEIEQMLLGVFSSNAYTITTFNFPKMNGVYEINVYFIGDVSIWSSFCKITEANNRYYIEIDISKIPMTNTNVYIGATVSQVGQESEFEQEYSFVIPGIYRLNDVFKDESLYELIIDEILALKEMEQYKSTAWGNLVYGAEDDDDDLLFSYVFYDAAILIETLDCSGNGIANISGLNKLINLKELTLDGNGLTGTDKLNGISGLALERLSARGCNIVTTDLTVFRTLVMLEEVTLSNNRISAVSDVAGSYFYRRIKILNLSNQDGLLTNIDGIDLMPYLTDLNLENNNILIYSPLLDMPSLKRVYVSNRSVFANSSITGLYNTNTVEESSVSILDAYGVEGSINHATFINLIDRRITVIKNGSVLAYDGDILAANRALNAIFCYHTLYYVNSQFLVGDFDISLNGIYMLDIVLPTNAFLRTTSDNVQTVNITQSITGSFYVYFKIKYNDVTVYRQVLVKVGS